MPFDIFDKKVFFQSFTRTNFTIKSLRERFEILRSKDDHAGSNPFLKTDYKIEFRRSTKSKKGDVFFQTQNFLALKSFFKMQFLWDPGTAAVVTARLARVRSALRFGV